MFQNHGFRNVFWNEATLFIFHMVSFQTLIIKLLYFWRCWKYIGKFIGRIMVASKTVLKTLLLWSKPIWEPNRKSWYNGLTSNPTKRCPKHTKSDEIQTSFGGLQKWKIRGTKNITKSFLNIWENGLVWCLNEKGPNKAKSYEIHAVL